MLYNPLNESITRTIKMPVYFTGQHGSVKIREKEGNSKSVKVDRDYHVTLERDDSCQGLHLVGYGVMRSLIF
jgi:uncharacterized protein YgiM (DUF1202 family)